MKYFQELGVTVVSKKPRDFFFGFVTRGEKGLAQGRHSATLHGGREGEGGRSNRRGIESTWGIYCTGSIIGPVSLRRSLV